MLVMFLLRCFYRKENSCTCSAVTRVFVMESEKRKGIGEQVTSSAKSMLWDRDLVVLFSSKSHPEP